MIRQLQRFVAGSEAQSSGEVVCQQLFVEGELEGVEGEVWEGSPPVEG